MMQACFDCDQCHARLTRFELCDNIYYQMATKVEIQYQDL